VEELGRHFRENPSEIETWSKESGLPIPEECKVPFVNPPKSLPLRLKVNFKQLPKEVRETEFLNAFFSIETCLMWALRENVDIGDVDFFIPGIILRKIASSAYHRRFSFWKCAVLLYKDKIFIDEIIPKGDKVLKKGLNEPDLSKHGRRFIDVMKNGGPGNRLYNGEDVDVRSTKSISFGNHKIITVTRLSCQSFDGPIDSQENYVEVKTMLPHSEEKFAKFKSCSLWIHSALVGVNTVYCGIRSDDGLLLDVKRYTMEDLTHFGKEYWSPNEILAFLDTVLMWLKQKLNKSASRTRHGEEWLKSKLLAEEAPTFTLSCDGFIKLGDGFIRLTAEDHPEFRRVITEKYDHIGKNNRNEYSSKDFDQSDDDNVPDTQGVIPCHVFEGLYRGLCLRFGEQ
jgi:hypothetical protein